MKHLTLDSGIRRWLTTENILEVKDLEICFLTHVGKFSAVRGITFEVGKGEMLGIVGESGSGKSVTSLSLLRLLPFSAQINAGSILYKNRPLTMLSEKEMENIRGNEIGMIFQDPSTALNPVLTIGTQLIEPLLYHQKLSLTEARQRALEMLALVGMSNPDKRLRQYPHVFSGGMRQRVMIAMALITNPELLIADEPTAALDVTIQAQVLQIMKKLNEESDTSIILISHNLAAVAELCRRIIVMYSGIIVEQGTARDIFDNARHPYTQGLIKALPKQYISGKERLTAIEGQPPGLLNPPSGCPFWPRCKDALLICKEQRPADTELSPFHKAACWLLHPHAFHLERGFNYGEK